MGGLIRTVLVLAIVLLVCGYFFGYLPKTASVFGTAPTAAATTPAGQDRVARAAERVDATLSDAALTTKIKAKIALDDTLKTADIHVSTRAGVITLSGNVGSEPMQQRILQLTKETAGVKSVVNEIKVDKVER